MSSGESGDGKKMALLEAEIKLRGFGKKKRRKKKKKKRENILFCCALSHL